MATQRKENYPPKKLLREKARTRQRSIEQKSMVSKRREQRGLCPLQKNFSARSAGLNISHADLRARWAAQFPPRKIPLGSSSYGIRWIPQKMGVLSVVVARLPQNKAFTSPL